MRLISDLIHISFTCKQHWTKFQPHSI